MSMGLDDKTGHAIALDAGWHWAYSPLFVPTLKAVHVGDVADLFFDYCREIIVF